MALGNGNYRGGNNQNQMWEPTYYSRLRIKNTQQNLVLSFNFWKGTLKIIISELGAPQDGKSNDLAYIHLSPTKARIMAEAVEKVMATPENVSFGVDTGAGEVRGFIAIGREQNIPYLFIAKVDNNGNYESSQRFNFNIDYNYMLVVHDIEKLKCQKDYMNSVELEQFRDILIDYARSASGALGASFYDIGRYEAAKTTNIIHKIAEKVGASEGRYSNNGGSNKFFDESASAESSNNNKAPSGNNTKYSSIEDLEREFM